MTSAWRKACVLVAAVSMCWGCFNGSGRTREASQDQARPAQELRSQLSRLGGRYEWNEDVRRFVFTDKPRLAEIVGEGSDATIDQLVDCIDDQTPSATLLNGQPVLAGVLCREALGLIIYYEATEPSGDIAPKWPGNIEPTATAADLQAAKRAWREVVEKKSYRRL